jgi:hypothetical protein
MEAPTTQSLSSQEYDERKSCLEQIKYLSKEQCEGLFLVLKQNTIAYTENSNGIFFDLTALSSGEFVKIRDFLNLCTTQNQNEEVRTKELQTLRDVSGSKNTA